MPLYILVNSPALELYCWKAFLQNNVIPIEPGIKTYRIKIRQDKGHTVQKTVQRRQFPTTAAYTFTDYHSQLEGQNLACVIIDIRLPPIGA